MIGTVLKVLIGCPHSHQQSMFVQEIFLNFKFDTSKSCLNSINGTPKEIKQTLEKEKDIDPTLFKSVNSGTQF